MAVTKMTDENLVMEDNGGVAFVSKGAPIPEELHEQEEGDDEQEEQSGASRRESE